MFSLSSASYVPYPSTIENKKAQAMSAAFVFFVAAVYKLTI